MEALEAYRKHLGPVMRFCANALVAFACVTMNIELSAIVTPAQKRVLGDRRRRTLSSLEAVAEVGASSSEAPAAIPMACLLYTSPSPRDQRGSRMPSSA